MSRGGGETLHPQDTFFPARCQDKSERRQRYGSGILDVQGGAGHILCGGHYLDYQEVEQMTAGEIIRAKRRARGMTQADLGRAVHVTESMICQIERGSKTITLPLAKEVANVLRCSVGELAGDTDNRTEV